MLCGLADKGMAGGELAQQHLAEGCCAFCVRLGLPRPLVQMPRPFDVRVLIVLSFWNSGLAA